MKLYRNLIVLAVIVALLGTSYYFVYKYEPESSDESENSPLKTVSVFKTDKENIKSLEITTPDESYVLTIDENSNWIVNNDKNIRVSQSKIDTLLYDASSISAQDIVTENAEDLHQYGFDSPERKAVITTNDGNRVTFLAGDKTADGKHHFVMLKGSDTVYIKSVAGVEGLTKALYLLRDTALYSISKEDISKIKIKKTGSDEYVIERENVGTKEEPSYVWKMKAPIQGEIDEFFFGDEIIAKITVLTHDKPVIGKTESECGLLNPYAVYTVSDGKNSFTVTVGNEDGEYRYVKVNGYDGFYLVKSEELSFIEISYKQILNKLIHVENIDEVNGVTIKGHNKEYKLTHTGSGKRDSYMLNGKQLTEKNYKKAYQAVISVSLEDFVSENATGTADVTINYDRKDGKKSEVSFISYDDRNYIVKVNGKGNLKIKKKQIDAIFDRLEEIYNS